MNDNPLSADELIHALEQAGRAPDLDLIHTCLARVAELEPALLDLLRVASEERYDDLDEIEDDPRGYSDIHAGYLLLAARSLAALPLFGQIFRDAEREHLLDWFDTELDHYGAAARPVFTELILDETVYPFGRAAAAGVLSRIAQKEPEQRTAVIETLHQVLPPVPEADDFSFEGAVDEVWTWAALELGKLGDRSHLEQIKALYAADAFETWILGDYEEYLELLEEPKDVPPPFDITEIYTRLQNEAAWQAEMAAERASRSAANANFLSRQSARTDEWQAMLDRQAERAAQRAAARGERPSSTHEHSAPGEPTIRKEPKVGRNDPCPCGSGLKYKKCHGRSGGG